MDEVLEFLRLNAALIVSICAVVLTVRTLRTTHEHNRLMVRPRLTTFTTQRFATDDAAVLIVQSVLRNSGLGPAVIVDFAALLDGDKIEVESSGGYFPIFAKTIRAKAVPERSTFAHLNRGYVMAKDEEIVVAHVGIRSPFYPELQKDLKRFHIRVTFESAYGELFVYDSRDHLDDRVDSPGESLPVPLADTVV